LRRMVRLGLCRKAGRQHLAGPLAWLEMVDP
jgi:hypothetical protein